MPYIKPKDRIALRSRPPETPGELNYLFTKIINEYLHFQGLNYQNINNVIGALEGTKLEFYRRLAVPYENTKISENGDVTYGNT